MPVRRLLPLLALLWSAPALAEAAPFDLAGPVLDISVTRGGTRLPIAEVPQLAQGDLLDVAADLPDDQAAHYVLVAAFLRGSTNPPPDKWFFRADAWTKKGKKGFTLTVPKGAQQVMLFLAPETGGDYGTLRNAVQGKPGAFVRAAQELAQASLDRARLDTYLAAVRKTVPGDPGRLDRITPLLARSLQVKVNPDCLAKLPELQAACLLQNQESLVLNDGHSNAITDAVQGPGADLALQLSATPQGGLGYYSPYIAAIRDVIGILASIHTAKYQYIPALGVPDGGSMRLVLNAPPSFHNPKSVLVAALPIVAPVHVPPLQLVDAAPVLCAQARAPLLPVAGAPLVYATHYAHDLVLRAKLDGGRTVDLPATPDVERGGLVIHVDGKLGDVKTPIDATLHGVWGFDAFDGPRVQLHPALAGQWRIASAGADSANLAGGVAACVEGVTVAGKPAAWKLAGADAITVPLPPHDARTATTIAVAGPGGADTLTVAAAPAPQRFQASLVARDVRRPDPVQLTLDQDDAVPSDATLTVSLRAAGSQHFTGRETVEIATEGGASTTLGVGHGLTLADPQIALATLVPDATLGASAFGLLRARVVSDGTAGEWVPVGTLVRLPRHLALQCPPDPKASCTLSGDDLFLLSAVSATPGFEQPVPVAAGFPGSSLAVPHPSDALYLRLHDDPRAVARFKPS